MTISSTSKMLRTRKRPHHRPSTSKSTKLKHLAILLLSIHLRNTFQITAKEITATNEWQLLQENDTIPAGLHVRVDLSTGEKWAKLPATEELGEEEEALKAAAYVENVAEMDATGALTIVPDDDSDSHADDSKQEAPVTTSTTKDYTMMHRVMSQLPPEELASFGGLPALPSINTTTTNELTTMERQEFEAKMELLWQHRQNALQKMQADGTIADLPKILSQRIETLKEYLMDSSGDLLLELLESRRRQNDQDDEQEQEDNDGTNSLANNVIEALRDLEFQLSDVDMARDFHTLGGWPYLVALLDDTLHNDGLVVVSDDDTSDNNHQHHDGAAAAEVTALVDEIRALAATATTIGTAVSNLGEFRHWALEDVSLTMNELRKEVDGTREGTTDEEKMTALSLLTRVFEEELEQRTEAMAGGTMAVVEGPSSDTFAMAKSRATFKLRAINGLGSLLRGNPNSNNSS